MTYEPTWGQRRPGAQAVGAGGILKEERGALHGQNPRCREEELSPLRRKDLAEAPSRGLVGQGS